MFFLKTDEIITSVYYTLGLHTNYHSALDFKYQENFSRHCSGNWLDNPIVTVEHNVNKTFHYWTEIIEHLSPARYKSKLLPSGRKLILYRETLWIIDSNLVTPVEKMNMVYLNCIIQEKQFGLEKATWALSEIKRSESLFTSAKDYQEQFNWSDDIKRAKKLSENILSGWEVYDNKKVIIFDD